jgi:hypothetical protein
MATGVTGTAVIDNSFRPMLDASKFIIEHVPQMDKLVRKETIPAGQGGAYRQPTWNTLDDAQDLQEGVDVTQAQQLADTIESYTPTEVGHLVSVTDRVKKTVGPKVIAAAGKLMGEAMARRIDKDGLTMLDGFSLPIGSASTALTWEHIGAARTAIFGGGGGAAALFEPAPRDAPVYGVFHPHQTWILAKDFAPAGSVELSSGKSVDIQASGKIPSRVAGVEMYEDGNLTIDSSDDAKGGVYSKEALLLVMDEVPETRQEDSARSRGTIIVQTCWYIFAEHRDKWGREMVFDAVMPVA